MTGAGHAWAIADGNAKLFEDGRVKLDVEGLVLTPEGTNPVANGRVVVSCNGGGAGNVVQSGLVPLSMPDGNAAFNGTLPIPSPCLDPVVFFASPGGAWFAGGLTARRPFHSRREESGQGQGPVWRHDGGGSTRPAAVRSGRARRC